MMILLWDPYCCNKEEKKHCQRRNGPEGWVLLTKETSSYTNLDQIPKFKIFRPNFNIKILTKHSLHNLTKPQQQNTDQTSVSKVSLELQLQTLGQTLCSKSEQNLALWPNFSFQNCIKLSSKRFSSSTSATVTNSTSFELASSQATRHINQVYKTGVSEWVSELVSDKQSQWSDLGPINILIQGEMWRTKCDKNTCWENSLVLVS